jgi:hypothetical protein
VGLSNAGIRGCARRDAQTDREPIVRLRSRLNGAQHRSHRYQDTNGN